MSGQSYSSSTTCYSFLRRFFQKARRGLGSCFSVTPFSSCADARSGKPPTPKVIKSDGTLMEYFLPIRVRYVLLTTQCVSSILCDADGLSYGRHIQALDSDHVLRPGNIYFVLPKRYLSFPLTAAEMAALASRANSALAKASSKDYSKKRIHSSRGSARKGVRILPVAAEKSDCYERLNEDCVFGGGAEVPVLDDACKRPYDQDGNTTEDIQNLPEKTEGFDNDGDTISDEKFEKFMEEMAERSKKQMKPNFYRRKRFSPTLSTIPEEYEV